MRILHRALLAFGCVVALGLVQSVASFTSMQFLAHRIERLAQDPLTQTEAARAALDAFAKAELEVTQTMEAIRPRSSADSIARFKVHVAAAEAALAAVRGANPSAELLAATEAAQASLSEWTAKALVIQGVQPATALPAPHVLDALQRRAMAGLQALTTRARQDAEQLAQDTLSVERWTERMVLAGALVALLAGIGIAVVAALTLTRPLERLRTRMHAIVNGDYDSDVKDQSRKDEIGEIAQALEVVKTALADRRRLEEQRAVEARAAEVARRDAEEQAIERERAMVVRSIGSGMARLAEKDLTFRLQDDLPAAYAQLRTDFNAAMEQLEQALSGVTAASASISAGTRDISSAFGDLSRRTENQATSLQETAAALDEITATVRNAAEGAGQAYAVVAGAAEDAERSGDVVRKTVEAMNGIETSSQQIGRIIGVIDEIAFQTNLLALNAGVEAARAGEAGRGFAVVASEVRALAQRSGQAAKEIKTLIRTSSTQVGQGVVLVSETGAALERIIGKVGEIKQIVSDIAIGAKEQATGLQQVNASINEMDKVTQQNAAMAEQTMASSNELADETDRLANIVDQFNVRRGDKVVPLAPKAMAPARRPPARPALKHAAGRSRPTVAATARALKPAADDEENWAEF